MAKKNLLRKKADLDQVHNKDFDRLLSKSGMGDEETKRLNVNVPIDLYADFKQICRRQRMPMSAVIVRYIQEYIDEHGRK